MMLFNYLFQYFPELFYPPPPPPAVFNTYNLIRGTRNVNVYESVCVCLCGVWPLLWRTTLGCVVISLLSCVWLWPSNPGHLGLIILITFVENYWGCFCLSVCVCLCFRIFLLFTAKKKVKESMRLTPRPPSFSLYFHVGAERVNKRRAEGERVGQRVVCGWGRRICTSLFNCASFKQQQLVSLFTCSVSHM